MRYEVGIYVYTVSVVWAHGPFPCGSHSDLRVFQQGVKNALDPDEMVIADRGYNDERCSKNGNNKLQSRNFSVCCA